MSEQTMRGRVVRALRSLNAIPVENPVLPGTPDVNYVEGWIELKQLTSWPAQDNTPVRVDIYTQQQRIWALRRRMAGGTAWFLLQCGREWLLLDGAVAALNVNIRTRQELYDIAFHTWSKSWTEEELVRWISSPQNAFTFGDGERATLKQLLQSGTVSLLDDI